MFISRQFQDILTEYISTIQSTGSPLSLDPNPSSPFYVLARANSAIIQDLELRFASLISSYSPLTASGSYLDNIISYSSIVRLQPSFAEGVVTILPTSTAVSLPINTILTDLVSGTQFSTTESVITNTALNTTVTVSALSLGSESNLSAGTLLFNSELLAIEPSLKFYVGEINPDKSFSNGLAGGSDLESDSSLLARYLSFLNSNSNPYSIYSIRSVLQSYSGVSKSYAKTTIPGVLEVWVDFVNPYSKTEVDALKSFLEPYIPAGIVVSVSQVSIIGITLSMKVTPFNRSDSISSINSEIINMVNTIVDLLDVGENLRIQSLQAAISGVLVQSCVITEPTVDVEVNANEVIVVSSINVSYPS